MFLGENVLPRFYFKISLFCLLATIKDKDKVGKTVQVLKLTLIREQLLNLVPDAGFCVCNVLIVHVGY